MGTWTSKFRNPALVAGVLAIGLAVNPAFAKDGPKRSGVGFVSGAALQVDGAGTLGLL